VSYLFDDLNAAAAFAANSSTKTLVLMNDAMLAAGDYTIPAGVTLLIPFDSANTMFTTQVLNTGTYKTPTAYRTLTMADGANLVINGSMSVSAMQMYAETKQNAGGSPTGPAGFVKMQGNKEVLGLVGYWDVVAWDEFEQQKGRNVEAVLIDTMQNYLANKSFNRGKATHEASASMCFVGNTKHTVPYMLKNITYTSDYACTTILL
jgi:hypothetical protein